MNTQIEKNRREFENSMNRIQKSPQDLNTQMSIAREAATKAWLAHPGFYFHNQLEEELLSLGQKFKYVPNKNVTLKKNTTKTCYLHVLTTAYPTGGHTRLVERWIRARAHYNEVHSIIITDQGLGIPSWLSEAVQLTGGNLIIIPLGLSVSERSQFLRTVAYRWADRIILHIHPNDSIPLIAFGNTEGPPVIFLNHADHVFWLGVGISDLIADPRVPGQEISLSRRQVKQSEILPLPLNSKQLLSTSQYKKKFGINEDTVVLLTIASAFKFIPFGILNYMKVMTNIINQCPDVILYVIGADKNNELWQQAISATNGRIIVQGVLEDIEDYYGIADIFVESFPMSSPTAALDAALYGVPVVRSPKPLSNILTIEYYDGMNQNALSLNEYSEYLINIINDKKLRVTQTERQRTAVSAKHIGKGWNDYLDNLLTKIPSNHSIGFSNQIPSNIDYTYDEIRAQMQLLNGGG
ncbi:glycosyltransferase [Priestia sp. YIM B13489]|uniref:glycosyltransferase n=1 Tax=Priestia sp. YIM B13489 TaxID=3366313 RepID=UPI00366E8307